MAMDGMAKAAQDELVTRYFKQAVAQGMNPIAALDLAQRAAGDMLGPLRQVATSEEIYGTASPAERMAAPRLAISDGALPMRTPRPAAAPRAPEASMRPATVRLAPAARDIRFERPDPVVMAPAASEIMLERPDPMQVRFAPAARDIRFDPPRDIRFERPDPVVIASAARDMRFESPDPVQARLAPAARDIRFEDPDAVMLAPAAMDILMEPELDPRAVMGHSTRSYPLDVRPNTEAELRDLMNAMALEEAASRAFNAPPPPPPTRTMERASFADSLLRSLGLR